MYPPCYTDKTIFVLFYAIFNVMFQVIHILDKISKNVKNSELIDWKRIIQNLRNCLPNVILDNRDDRLFFFKYHLCSHVLR